MIYAIIIAVLIAVDQITKYLARTYLSTVDTIPIIKNFLHLTYVENRGAAFGMLQNKSIFFIIVSLIIIIGLIIYVKKYNPLKIQKYIISVIIAGAIGNLIDRVLFGFVTDMIDFKGIWQWVFNIADICIVLGTIFLLIAMMAEEKQKVESGQIK